jgi:trigger factor
MSPAANAPTASPATGPSPAENPAEAKAAEPVATGLTVTTSPCPGSRLAMEVAVPGSRCQASYDQALARLSRSVKLPGFRKGKVPRAVLQQRIGQVQIRATALEDLVDNVFREASSQEKIVPISRPELREGFEAVLERFTPGSDLTFTLEMEVEPTPTLKATKGLKAEAEPVVHDPARVDELIEQSRRQLAALVPVEDRPRRWTMWPRSASRAASSTPVSRSAAAAAMAWRWSWRTAA